MTNNQPTNITKPSTAICQYAALIIMSEAHKNGEKHKVMPLYQQINEAVSVNTSNEINE